MQFMMCPLNSRRAFKKEEPEFADIRAYLLSLEPPKYPLPIDADLAARGEGCYGELRRAATARMARIGRIPTRWCRSTRSAPTASASTACRRSSASITTRAGSPQEYKATAVGGYQAPPLDGIWATAPYFHNGSVPTVYDVLNSKARPKIFTRSYRTDAEAYDADKLGWKVQVLDGPSLAAATVGTRGRSSGARSTTRRNPAAATVATPSATT